MTYQPSTVHRYTGRRMAKIRISIAIALAAASAHSVWRANAQSLGSPTYTREQAASGPGGYTQSCASCHGENLDDGQFAPSLSGSVFRQQWGSKPVDELLA